MKATVFEYTHYKAFINDLINSYPAHGRGQRKALAEAIGCQVAYITHVLSGESHFSLEQTEAASRYFNLSQEETEYLILLVQFNRAGTPELKKFFERLLREQTLKFSKNSERLNIKEGLSYDKQTIYYSSWLYAAVHMAVTIPELQTLEALAMRFRLSTARTLEILEFLIECGMVFKEHNLYHTRTPQVHLDKTSPLVRQHHFNWRSRSLSSLDEVKPEDLHYSLAFSVAKNDLPKIREHLQKGLRECVATIKPSKEEELAVICIDFFRI